MIHERYIVCDNDEARYKTYSTTQRKAKFLVNKKSKSSVNRFSPNKLKNQTGYSQGGVYSTSKSQWACPINDLSKNRNIEDWKSYAMKNGVIKYYKDYLFSEPVNCVLKFQMTIGRKKASMTMVFPTVKFDDEEELINFEKDVGFYVKSAMKFMAKKYNIGMDVSQVHIAGDSGVDYETKVRGVDKELIAAFVPIETSYMENGVKKKIMYDGSGGVLNCEGNKPDIPIKYSSLPVIHNDALKWSHKVKNSVQEIRKINLEIKEVISEMRGIRELLQNCKTKDKNRVQENIERGML